MIVHLKRASIESEEAGDRVVRNLIKGTLVEHYGKPITPDTIDTIAKELSVSINSLMRLK